MYSIVKHIDRPNIRNNILLAPLSLNALMLLHHLLLGLFFVVFRNHQIVPRLAFIQIGLLLLWIIQFVFQSLLEEVLQLYIFALLDFLHQNIVERVLLGVFLVILKLLLLRGLLEKDQRPQRQHAIERILTFLKGAYPHSERLAHDERSVPRMQGIGTNENGLIHFLIVLLLLRITNTILHYVRFCLRIRVIDVGIIVREVQHFHVDSGSLRSLNRNNVLVYKVFVQSLQMQGRYLLCFSERKLKIEAIIPVSLHHNRLEIIVSERQVIRNQTHKRLCG